MALICESMVLSAQRNHSFWSIMIFNVTRGIKMMESQKWRPTAWIGANETSFNSKFLFDTTGDVWFFVRHNSKRITCLSPATEVITGFWTYYYRFKGLFEDLLLLLVEKSAGRATTCSDRLADLFSMQNRWRWILKRCRDDLSQIPFAVPLVFNPTKICTFVYFEQR